MPLFLFIFHIYNIHLYSHIHSIHLSVAIRRGLSDSLSISSSLASSVGKTEPRNTEPGKTEPSRESNSGVPYSKPTCYQLSHAAPYLSHAAPCHTKVTLFLSVLWICLQYGRYRWPKDWSLTRQQIGRCLVPDYFDTAWDGAFQSDGQY